MTRILPGVEIQVIKEIVPQQLNPSGVVAMIGMTEKGEVLVPTPVSSYAELADKFGSSDRFSVTREARQAFQNGVFQVFVVPIGGMNGSKASLTLKDRKGRDTLTLSSRSFGEDSNSIAVKVEDEPDGNAVKILVSNGANIEIFDRLSMDAIADSINARSALVTAQDMRSSSKAPNNNPAPAEANLAGGVTGVIGKEDYEAALERIEGEPDIDLVVACDVTDPEIHALVEAHCMKMSLEAKNRIGLGTVAKGESIKDIVARTKNIASDRFVLVAPYGCMGAMAGLISKLNYFESPTFKPVSGIAKLEKSYTPSEQMEMLKAGVLPLEAQRGRGIVVVKGISTSKEQISVTRVADHAVRGVKNISDMFIGTLNNENGRMALKGNITAFLTQMEREGSLVPGTDGKEPAFLLDVYSSETDFAQGIVRINLAVRPVRAIDYIYATIKVEA